MTFGRILFSNSLSAGFKAACSLFRFGFDMRKISEYGLLPAVDLQREKKYLFVYTITPYLWPEMKISDSRYSKCLYFSSNALARKMEKLALESWKPVNLSPSHAYLLMMVIDQPGVQPGALASEMQLTPSTITRLLEKLEERKLLTRSVEGKLTNVYPTAKARDLLGKLKDCVHHFTETYSSIIGKEEGMKMVSHMNRITDQLEQ
jgi:MarR family transcriptional regulator, organic hydroperoxide resistance regulator